MPNYIINKNTQSNGDNEVHNKDANCGHMPLLENQIALGWHATCHEAVNYAKNKWGNNQINGCYYCVNECHTT